MPPPKSEILQGTLDLLVLRTIEAIGPMHGWGVAKRIEQVSGEALHLAQGTIYPALIRLEQRGWIAPEWGMSDTSRKARFYTITKSGRRQLRQEKESWERMVAIITQVLENA
jgi:PadR family transcriptional regulator PadR